MKNTIMFAALAAILSAKRSNNNEAVRENQASPGGLAQLKVEAQFIDDVGDWIEGAGQDIAEWTVGAGDAYIDFIQDTDQWITGAIGNYAEFVNDAGDWLVDDLDDFVVDIGQEFEDWVVDTGDDINDMAEGAFEDAGEFLIDVDDWIDGAAGDTGEWFIGTVEDTEVLFEGAGEDFTDWVIYASEDILDWSEGVIQETGDWTVDAGLTIADWTVETVEDVGEPAIDVFDRMGDFSEQIIQELEDMFSDVGSWVDGAIDDIGGFTENCVEQITKLDDHFVALGEFAADIYKQAENAVEDAAMELYQLGDAVVQEAVRIGKEVEKGLKQMEDLGKDAINTMHDAIKKAGRALRNLSEEFLNTAAGQKTKIFIMGAVEEVSKVAQAVAGGTVRLYNRLQSDDLHVVLADGIQWFGEGATHFVTETFVNEVGGKVAQVGTIPIETVMKMIGLEEEGKAIRNWVQGSVEDMSKHVKQALERHFEVFETLLRDPEAFVELIEEEPWRVLNLANPIIPQMEWQFTWAEEKLREFTEYDVIDIKLPKGWLSDL